jgi:hypothetical protein
MSIIEPRCRERQCKWFEGVRELEGTEASQVVVCPAYPKGIPSEIAYGPNKHLTLRGDEEAQVHYEKAEA